jgi:hypothetical protein
MNLSFTWTVFVAALIGGGTVNAQTSQFAEYSNITVGEDQTGGVGHGKLPRREQSKIALLAYDFAHLDPAVLQAGKSVTSEIFANAGVETMWLDCQVSQECDAEDGRPQFRLEILLSVRGVSNDNPLGFAVPCAKTNKTCVSYILYSPIDLLAIQSGTSPGRILGHVMAHEIGHALLGPNAHSVSGIMQNRLRVFDMERILYFTGSQSQRMRAELAARIATINK